MMFVYCTKCGTFELVACLIWVRCPNRSCIASTRLGRCGCRRAPASAADWCSDRGRRRRWARLSWWKRAKRWPSMSAASRSSRTDAATLRERKPTQCTDTVERRRRATGRNRKWLATESAPDWAPTIPIPSASFPAHHWDWLLLLLLLRNVLMVLETRIKWSMKELRDVRRWRASGDTKFLRQRRADKSQTDELVRTRLTHGDNYRPMIRFWQSFLSWAHGQLAGCRKLSEPDQQIQRGRLSLCREKSNRGNVPTYQPPADVTIE